MFGDSDVEEGEVGCVGERADMMPLCVCVVVGMLSGGGHVDATSHPPCLREKTLPHPLNPGVNGVSVGRLPTFRQLGSLTTTLSTSQVSRSCRSQKLSRFHR